MLKFKKIITISICSLVAATSIVWGMKSIEPKDGVGILLDGKKLELDVEPFIENNRTLIPVRGVMEGLGADVGWDAKERLVTIDKEDIKIKLFIGSDVAIVTKEEGKEEKIQLDVPAKIVNDRTFIPGRFVTETVGAQVDWEPELRAMIITSENYMVDPEKQKDETVSAEAIDYEIINPSEISENEVLSKWYKNNYKKKGIYSLTDEKRQYVLVAAGEKNTGGYMVEIDNVLKTSNTAYVYARLISPERGRTMAITYPNVLIKFNKNDIVMVEGEISNNTHKKEPINEPTEDEIGESLNEMGKAIPIELVQEMKLYSLFDEEIKTFTKEETKEIIDILNTSKTYTGAYISMLAGNNIKMKLKDGAIITVMSYGNENHVILSGEVDGQYVGGCIIAPEVGKILLDIAK
ncbi:MAG: protease complex subunit PrcB family protein [Clostridium sp.]|jgi:hypothetical protein|nr:protease complex subunit PrcB family protein [Clostridium sp.]